MTAVITGWAKNLFGRLEGVGRARILIVLVMLLVPPSDRSKPFGLFVGPKGSRRERVVLTGSDRRPRGPDPDRARFLGSQGVCLEHPERVSTGDADDLQGAVLAGGRRDRRHILT